MSIISQDKMEVYNFDEIFRLYVDNWLNGEFAIEPNCFCIKAEKSNDNMICAFLGGYKTEERAKEVLQEIIKAYLDCNEQSVLTNYEYENCWCLRNVIYEMPAD